MILNILGTAYNVVVKKYEEDEAFDRNSFSGYCDGYAKKIVVCDMHTYKGWEHENEETICAAQKQTLRHEIVHAFFNESGLCESANIFDGAWTKNEELVDWIANQGEKIYKAWKESEAV